MHDGELETRQDNPDDVHYERYCAPRRFGFAYLAAKRRKDAPGEFEALYAERNADNRKAQQYAAEKVAEEDNKSTEHEEQDIADQRHEE